MLVYGDQREIADPRERLDWLASELVQVERMPAGIERHSKLVGALIAAGQLLQGVADEQWPSSGLDCFVHALAMSVVESFDTGLCAPGALPRAPAVNLPSRVELRLPEGFAFYCVYPESYITAARQLRLTGPARVIGIRSIGATLGPVVAAALGARVAANVRPFGDPFARRVELDEDLIDGDAHYVIVDEGPGLSGSSFGAVADWLEDRGVPLDRIAFLPSHDGEPGREASNAHRLRWARAQRVPARFDASFLSARFGELEHFAGGGSAQRRKFIASRDSKQVLLKFAGLGSIGEQKLDLAYALHSAGLTPEPLGLVHGFLAERWCDDSTPLAGPIPIAEVGHYLGTRARLLPAPADSGASIEDLMRMCRRNIALACGEPVARQLQRFPARQLQSLVCRVRTDNKLDREEWLRMDDGRLVKTDAVDHHQAHDLIGCQDLAWDVAGAIVEFDLDAERSARLVTATEHNIHPGLLEFCCVAYAAFRLGQSVIASNSTPEADRYNAALHGLLSKENSSWTWHESAFD